MKRQFVYIRQRRVVIRFHIAPCRRTKLLHMILLPCVMRVLTRHSKQQKESVRRRGSSLRRKAKQIALQGSIRMLLVYEDPTHGVWHITKYCPADMAFPDVNELIAEHDRTGRAPRAWPCRAESNTTHSGNRQALPRKGGFPPQRNALKISAENPGNIDDTDGNNSTDGDDFTLSGGSTVSEGTSTDDPAHVAVKGCERKRERRDSDPDNDFATADQMITPQLEETGSQAHQRLFRWIWGG
ncbi:hypothetical protein HC256_006703 [Beauveria bassiana]|nr:hypothetical protein HC256_006606 [Beauveria bassiana]KAH8713570.1 hypothetical protein HC256_006703 [Beauveria bassiana]